ncbi:type II toxin-antitoxin system CcdA family antitoxin [Sphingomonas sp. LT1P40]|uniref:type II toxin-antitoxin system CcdA family antitoxin n=1 Tax=Alteristakelama amylovorans TaxID=3096166 RepID=UPI002FC8C587
MKQDSIFSGKRKPVNLSIDTGIVAAAREAGINLSQVSERAIRDAAKAERDRKWAEDNRDWAETWNAWVDEHGLPLARYRQF